MPAGTSLPSSRPVCQQAVLLHPDQVICPAKTSNMRILAGQTPGQSLVTAPSEWSSPSNLFAAMKESGSVKTYAMVLAWETGLQNLCLVAGAGSDRYGTVGKSTLVETRRGLERPWRRSPEPVSPASASEA